MNMPQDAGAAPAAPASQSVSGLARQHFDTVGPDGRQRGDAQPAQVAFIIKSIRIAEVAGHPQFGRKADAVAINKLRKTTVLQIALRFPLLREKRGPHAQRLSETDIAQSQDFSLKIEALTRTFAGQHGAIAGHVSDDFYLFAVEKLRGR